MNQTDVQPRQGLSQRTKLVLPLFLLLDRCQRVEGEWGQLWFWQTATGVTRRCDVFVHKSCLKICLSICLKLIPESCLGYLNICLDKQDSRIVFHRVCAFLFLIPLLSLSCTICRPLWTVYATWTGDVFIACVAYVSKDVSDISQNRNTSRLAEGSSRRTLLHTVDCCNITHIAVLLIIYNTTPTK